VQLKTAVFCPILIELAILKQENENTKKWDLIRLLCFFYSSVWQQDLQVKRYFIFGTIITKNLAPLLQNNGHGLWQNAVAHCI
jgi:hypothetical protein